MKTLVLDNYDSFTYNLVYMLRQEGMEVEVFRNDKIGPAACQRYDAIVLSPGPGVPKNAGNLAAIIAGCEGKVPILGVCLGHQAIAEHLGGRLRMLDKVYHGIQSSITLCDKPNTLFRGVSSPFLAGRYHSWDVAPGDCARFTTTAMTATNIMAIENRDKKLFGIQFHPESILTPKGGEIIRNFLAFCKNDKR